MPLFVAAILGGLVELAASLAGRVLIALAVGYVTYEGIDTGLTSVTSYIWSSFTGLPEKALVVMGLLRVDDNISVLLSALGARMLLNGLTSGSITKMVIK